MFKTFDPNKTVRHMSYREMRKQWEREKKLSDRFVTFLGIGSLIMFFIIAFVQMAGR